MAEVEEPFADVDDLKDRWPDFPAGAERTAKVLLEDASQFIVDVCPQALSAPEGTRRRVVCAVVRRAITAAARDMDGLSNTQVSTGPFSASYTSANPNGDFFLTKQETRALGGGRRGRAFGVQIADLGVVPRHQPWCDVTFGRACSCGAELSQGEPLWEA